MYSTAEDHLLYIKKERISFMHSTEARPKACANTRRENAPNWAHPHLHAVRTLKNWSYFRRTACSVDATFFNAVGGGEFQRLTSRPFISVHRPITPRKSLILSSLARCNYYTKFYLNPPLPPKNHPYPTFSGMIYPSFQKSPIKPYENLFSHPFFFIFISCTP